MMQDKLLISKNVTGRDALRQLDSLAISAPVLFILNEKSQIVGTLTDGDIRRGLLHNLSIDDTLEAFMFKNYTFFTLNNYSKEDLIETRIKKIRFLPVLNPDKTLVKILDIDNLKSVLPLSAVLMAGGKGERLLPLTKTTPKPMLKVGDKPILAYNIERLVKFGIEEIFISVKYLQEQIIEYFGDGTKFNCKISYLYENEPLGTIGALKNITALKHQNILVMNSDLLTDIDFEHFFDTFIEENAEMAVATIPYSINVPYAVMEFSDGKKVSGFVEKPQYNYYSNAGIYLLKKSLLDLIPNDQKYDATDLMNEVINSKKKLIAEPLRGYWLDIGRVDDYFKAQEDIKFLKF